MAPERPRSVREPYGPDRGRSGQFRPVSGLAPRTFVFRGMCLLERDLCLVVPEGLALRDPAGLDFRGVPVSGPAPGAGPQGRRRPRIVVLAGQHAGVCQWRCRGGFWRLPVGQPSVHLIVLLAWSSWAVTARRAVSRERCCASRPTGRLRVREASASPSALRTRRRRREGVDQADPQWRCGALAPGGSGELPPGERAFGVGVDELLEGGLIDEHGGYGPLAAGGVVGAQGAMELDAGRADAPAGAGAAEQSSDGRGAGTGGVGVGVETNGSEVVGRGVLVGEGVDRGEGGLCCGGVAPALGLCLAPGPGRRLPGVGGLRGRRVAGARVFSARCPRLPLGARSRGVGGWAKRAARPRGRRVSAGFLLRPHERSVHGGCGGPVLDVDVAHLGLVAGVVVRRLRVVGRRRDHGEPERGAGGRRSRPSVDVMRHGEPGGDVDVRRVDLDGGQVVEGDRGFARAGLGIEDDSVGGCRVGCLLGPARNLTSAGRDRRRPQESERPAGRRRERRFRPRGVRALRRRRPPQR